MKIQELIEHIKIEEGNRNQDKAKIVTPPPYVNANVVEYKIAGSSNRFGDRNQSFNNKHNPGGFKCKRIEGDCWWCHKPRHPSTLCHARIEKKS